MADTTLAIKYEQKHGEAYSARAWALFKAGKTAEALPDAQRGLQLEPGNAHGFNTRAHILEALGKKAEAVADFRRALAIDRSHAVSQEGLKRLGAAK
jgi:tetratricopeptide (TPR) repeat protein